MFTVDIEGLEDLKRDFRLADTELLDETRRAVTDAAMAGQKEAMLQSPVKTGELRNRIVLDSVRTSGRSVTQAIRAAKHYASYLHFGRGPVFAKRRQFLRFEIGGMVFFRRSVRGTTPHDFMRRAESTATERLQAGIERAASFVARRLNG